MSDENNLATVETLNVGEPTGSAKRQRSSIAFPYMDLSEAIGVAKAIHDHQGTGTCTMDQLAPWMNQSPTSSAFRNRLSAARLFGLVNAENLDAIQLTELGRLVVDAKREREGRAKAFLAVPLYRALYDKFKGGVVPPTGALETELVSLGVAGTLKETARRVLERSADQAGFYEAGRDRLVMPGFGPTPEPKPETKRGGGDGDGPDFGLDPLLVALLKKIPPAGNDWPGPNRVRWFRTFAMNVSQIYDGDGDPVELRIELDVNP